MIIVYLHTSLIPCGPTNQFKTFIHSYSPFAHKYYFILKSSGSSIVSSASRLNFLQLLKLLITSKNILFHSSGLLPDSLLFIFSFLFPQHHYVSTIRNIPWIDYFLLYPKIVAFFLFFVHLNIFSSKRILPICCSLPLLLAIQKRIPSCTYFVDNCYTGIISLVPQSKPNLTHIDSLRCLSLSPLIPRKNIDLIIASFSSLEILYMLDICGDGPLFKSLQRTICTSQINLRGYVTPSSEFFSFYGIFISFSESEGLPNSVIEALYNGLVCILSPIPPHKYLQQFTDRIIIIDDFSSKSLQSALLQAQASNYSSRIHNHFCEYFHPDRMLTDYMHIYTNYN